MSDHNQRALILPPSRGLARRSVTVPLAGSSGAWFGSRTRILRKDTEHVELSNRQLNARVAEATTMRALIDARIALARALTEMAALGEICAAHFLKARRQRASELLVHELKCQSDEASARATLIAAQTNLNALAPPAPVAASASAEAGLTPAEVDEILASLPDIPPEARPTVSLLLNARVSEKQKK
jgi:hypothetical protein